MSDADVCVVGAGAGGGVAAWALAERGLRVLLLETGPRHDPARYGTHALDWELKDSPFQVAEDEQPESYTSADGEELDPAYAHLRTELVTGSARPRRQRRPFRYSRAYGVGGSTLHYQGEAHRFPAHAFRMQSERGVAADWPLSYADLEPYYARVEELLSVAGDPGNPFKPARGPFPFPAHPLSAASLRIGEAARRLGWSHLPNTLAVLRGAAAGREACHYCNGCFHGCMVGAKSSVDVAVVPRAERTGRLRVVTGFRVARLEHRADGRVTGVIGRDAAGAEQRHRAAAVVLATGAIETPRILLNSAGGAHPDGVGNAHGQVGLHLMEFLFVDRRILFDAPLESYAGLPIDAKIWDWNGADPERSALPNGFVLGPSAAAFLGPSSYAWDAVPGFGRGHREAMRQRFGAAFQLSGFAEQLPRASNRVTLSDQTDRFGVPLARVETRLDRDDLEVLSAMAGRLRDLAAACGADDLGQVTAWDAPNATHVGGTCRMGRFAHDSVVDAFGAVHGHPNLVLADASALVTQGPGDSPSLTIQALALRAAEALAERAGRGEV